MNDVLVMEDEYGHNSVFETGGNECGECTELKWSLESHFCIIDVCYYCLNFLDFIFCICVYTTRIPSAQRYQKRVPDAPKLESQRNVKYHLDYMRVFYNSSALNH